MHIQHYNKPTVNAVSCLKITFRTDAKISFAEFIAGKFQPSSIFKRPFIICLFNLQGHLRKKTLIFAADVKQQE